MRTPARFAVLLLTTAVATLGAALAQTSSIGVAHSPTLGLHLVDAKGMALYVYSRDTPGVSTCSGQCAVNWPPVVVEPSDVSGVPGDFGTFVRDDGGRQLTYNGWPLYGWVRDAAPGDTTGHTVGGVWWIANVNPIVQASQTVGPTGTTYLVGPNGMTLYLFTRDTPGMSACVDNCLVNWPPLLAGFDTTAGVLPLAGEGVTGTLGYIERADGTRHVTIDGVALYTWKNDAVPGDTSGHGVGTVWFVVPADAAAR